MEQYKIPGKRLEQQTLDTLDVETLILAYSNSLESIQNGELMSDVDIMLQAEYEGRIEEVDAYFESLGV